jgi:hypothetical protein
VIGGALVIGFLIMGWFIMRDARKAIPEEDLAAMSRLREQGPHAHKQHAKAKARQEAPRSASAQGEQPLTRLIRHRRTWKIASSRAISCSGSNPRSARAAVVREPRDVVRRAGRSAARRVDAATPVHSRPSSREIRARETPGATTSTRSQSKSATGADHTPPCRHPGPLTARSPCVMFSDSTLSTWMLSSSRVSRRRAPGRR